MCAIRRNGGPWILCFMRTTDAEEYGGGTPTLSEALLDELEPLMRECAIGDTVTLKVTELTRQQLDRLETAKT